jgi:hypothetical protein
MVAKNKNERKKRRKKEKRGGLGEKMAEGNLSGMIL